MIKEKYLKKSTTMTKLRSELQKEQILKVNAEELLYDDKYRTFVKKAILTLESNHHKTHTGKNKPLKAEIWICKKKFFSRVNTTTGGGFFAFD